MKTTTYTALRQKLAAEMDRVNDDHEPLVVTRARGRPAVLMSLEDYNALAEMAHLASSATNARRLSEAIEQLNGDGGTERRLDE
ncbi:MAG: type II toxin-antitoxin system prevent-host-death family antitoxin [Alphaproteobacteria bacterium]|jgi:antitoxin YefM|nr:type II toxin-antitoxin system prevent-host-death family antitoxin [Alphaproteobacteria bacterium]